MTAGVTQRLLIAGITALIVIAGAAATASAVRAPANGRLQDAESRLEVGGALPSTHGAPAGAHSRQPKVTITLSLVGKAPPDANFLFGRGSIGDYLCAPANHQPPPRTPPCRGGETYYAWRNHPLPPNSCFATPIAIYRIIGPPENNEIADIWRQEVCVATSDVRYSFVYDFGGLPNTAIPEKPAGDPELPVDQQE